MPLQTTPVQKTLIIIGFGIFVALAALTASLPLKLRRHQDNDSSSNPTLTASLVEGDTAWVIVATIFGFLLSPALAFLYANLYGKNTSSILQLTTIVAVGITFLWIVFSFSLTYGKDAEGDQVLGFPLTYYMFQNVGAGPDASLAPTIPLSIYAVFELSFAILTPTIVTSVVADRVNKYGYLVFILAWHLVVYTPIAHIVWNPRGWFATNVIEDFSGGIVVNMLSAVTILAINALLGKQDAEAPRKPINLSSLTLSTLVVWFLWFGINAGKAHNAGPVAAQSIVNTIAASAASILTWFLYDLAFGKRTGTVSITNAVLVALVAITPASGYVTVGGAFCIAIVTTLITYAVAANYFNEAVEADQPLSAVSIHGIAGTIGFLATAIISYDFINPEGVNGLTFGRGIPLAHHISAVLAIWSCAFIAVYGTLFLTNLVAPVASDGINHFSSPPIKEVEVTEAK